MRRKHKIFYWVQDTGKSTSIWWVNGVGWVNRPRMGSGGRSNVKRCWTRRMAMKHCARINALGGRGHIGMFFYRKRVRLYRELWLPGFEPWT